MKTLLIILSLSLFAWSQSAQGTIRRVPSQYATIQAGIGAALDNDTVLVAEGSYLENINFGGKRILVGSQFVIDGDTTHISRTVINGSRPASPDSGSVVFFLSGEDSNSVLCGFTITGGIGTIDRVSQPGRVLRSGGAIFTNQSSPRIRRNYITNNTITYDGIIAGSGGIHAIFGNNLLIIENNRIVGNQVTNTGQVAGGGILLYNIVARVVNNVIADNRIKSTTEGPSLPNILGAGIFLQSASVDIIGNHISGNSGSSVSTQASGGGGLGSFFSNLNLIGNVVEHNSIDNLAQPAALFGGGVWAVSSGGSFDNNRIVTNSLVGGNPNYGGGGITLDRTSASLTNNIVAGNLAMTGGGISVLGPAGVDLINNTISFNRSAGNGGGIALLSGTIRVLNSIVWSDTGVQEIFNSGGTTRVLYSDVQGGWPSDSNNINVNPSFRDSTFRLADASRCIGAAVDSVQLDGSWLYAPPNSFYGVHRPSPAGSRPDIGACENDRGIPTSAGGPGNGVPFFIILEQNYPNPFNPTTTIRYSVSHSTNVTLAIYNTLGQQVAMPVSERKEAGVYQQTWNAEGLASGVYFYRLTTDVFTETKKLVLVK